MSCDHLCVTLVPLFNGLDIEDQRKINSLVKHRIYEKGELILSPDDSPKLVIVAQGNMKAYQLSNTGREQLLRVVEPGSYEGESLLLGAKCENLFCEALQKTTVCVLQQEDFRKLLIEYPDLNLKLLAINAEKTKRLEEQINFLMMEKVEERLVTYLLDLYKVTNETNVQIPMKMKELAGFLGTTPETLSRKLRKLKDENLIQYKRNNVELLDLDKLEDFF